MRIAVDARELHGQPTGVGRVLAGILGAWDRLAEARGHEIVLCAPGKGRPGGTLWEQIILPRRVREASADVLFAPAYTGPLGCPVPLVVAVYDVSFAAHPEWFGWREGVRRRVLTRMTARRAARVLTTSAFSQREIAQHLGVDPAKIDLVYPGVTAQTTGGEGLPRGERENLVLFVGSLFTRRHLPEAIDGFAGLARRRADLRLEIVGDNRTRPHVDFAQLAARTGVADRISLRAYVPDEMLADLYRRARAFMFLSEYEGFGLTPIEALAAGVPVMVLDTPIAREVYGDAALYVPSPDPACIERALERLLTDEPLRARLLEAAGPILARYSWERCARRVLEVLVEAGQT